MLCGNVLMTSIGQVSPGYTACTFSYTKYIVAITFIMLNCSYLEDNNKSAVAVANDDSITCTKLIS